MTAGSTAKVVVNLGKSGLELNAFAQNGAIFSWFDKISITLTSPTGKDIYSRSVTHNQRSYFTAASPYGKYTLRFTETDKFKWDCYYTLADFSKSGKSNIKKSHYDTIYNSNGLAIESVYNTENQKIYIISSHEKQPSRSIKNPLSANQLQEQVYDKVREASTNDLKDYQVNDMLYFEDNISEIEYNQDGYTMLTLGEGDSRLKWPFVGDLTNRFNQGDTLKLKFKVVEEYRFGNHVFENLDYCLEGIKLEKEGLYANIDDYLQ